MANVINFYRDSLCEDPIITVSPGVAGVVGHYANINNWTEQPINTGLTDSAERPLMVYATYINQDKNGNPKRRGCDFGFTFSGGSVLYDFDTSNEIIPFDIKTTDKVNTSPGAGNITNAFFTGQITYEDAPKRTGYVRFGQGIYQRSVSAMFGSYYQEPEDAKMSNRQTWVYDTSIGYHSSSNTFCQAVLVEFNANTRWHYCKLYSLVINETDCYAFFIGVDFDGSINDSNTDDPDSETFHSTYIIAVPKELYKDRVPKPYVGPVSKDSAEASFIPTRAKYRDELLGYNIDSLDKDPLGLCSANSTTRLVKMTKQAYMDLIDGIYSGDSTSVYGSIGQLAVNFFNQTGGRSAQDIQTMLSAIQTIHLVPSLNLTGQATNITIKALGGYALGKEVTVTPLAQQITERGEAGSISATITPEEASFLNYSPYTNATLIIPWVGNVRVDPSELYAVDANGNTVGGTIEMEYAFDALTGLLTIYTTSYVPGLVAKHLINLSQVNVAVELPISGIGTAGEKTGLRAITGAVTGLVGAITGNVPMAVSGVSKAVDASIDASKVSSVSNQGIGSISPYFSPTQAGLILTYPKPSNSANFAHDLGVKCNESGTVDSFKGYAEFINVDLSTVTATQGVKEQILAALERGVIIQ